MRTDRKIDPSDYSERGVYCSWTDTFLDPFGYPIPSKNAEQK